MHCNSSQPHVPWGHRGVWAASHSAHLLARQPTQPRFAPQAGGPIQARLPCTTRPALQPRFALQREQTP